MNKPPIGIMPKRFHDENRLRDLAAAINRRLQNPCSIPMEWIEEFNELIDKMEFDK